jgi:hypothetical protein
MLLVEQNFLISSKVFDPEITNAPAPPLFNMGHENPAPINVFDTAEVIEIMPVPDVCQVATRS